MRMRKKGNLEERLAACPNIYAGGSGVTRNMKLAAQEKEYIDFTKIFGNSNPVALEIGCGKGKFVCESAERNPGMNYIAVEKISNVLITAAERANAARLKNVYFLNCAAEVLPRYIKDGQICRIYLNFSNPLPKEGYKKQRLTHPVFLAMYRNFLTENGRIIQKTDDDAFYNFSLESYAAAGYEVLDKRTDLAANPVEDDVETEHERKFKAEGKKIYYISAGL